MSKEGRIIKEAYLTEVSLRRSGLVEIEREMLSAPEKWSKEVFVYGLNRLTIGISPYKVKDRDSRALMVSKVPVHQNEHSISIELPQQFMDFYLLGSSRLSTSTVGDMALVTVEATIIPISVESVKKELLLEEALAKEREYSSLQYAGKVKLDEAKRRLDEMREDRY
ncbi:MAG: hypothetical protein ACUVTD_07985 [Nitrososphaerales archaeon]